VNRTNKKLAGKKTKDIHYVDHLLVGEVSGSLSILVVDLVDGDRAEEKDDESTKRKRVETIDRGVSSPIKLVPLRAEEGGLFQLTNVWS